MARALAAARLSELLYRFVRDDDDTLSDDDLVRKVMKRYEEDRGMLIIDVNE